MAAVVNLIADQGANLSYEIVVSASNGSLWDLSTYTAYAQVRKNPYTNTYYSFTCNSFANGLITMDMTGVESANVKAGRYLYDVEIVSGSNTTTRVQEGLITFRPNITR